MLVKTYSAAVIGLEATTITIEVNLTKGVMFHLSGLADTAVKESYDRICAALPNVGYKAPTASLTINLSPADMKKEGSGFDLPMAVGILGADGSIAPERLKDYMLIGELGLDGKIKPVRAVLPIAIRARKEKFKGLIVPKDNVREAARRCRLPRVWKPLRYTQWLVSSQAMCRSSRSDHSAAPTTRSRRWL